MCGRRDCGLPVAVKERAAHVLEGLHAFKELIGAGVEAPGKAGDAEKLRRAAVDELAGHGDFIAGDGAVAVDALFHGGIPPVVRMRPL